MASILIVLFAYLLGSVSGSLVLGYFRKVDIRTLGSGNAGGTNALRTQGLLFALGVVTIDIGKGLLAARLPELFNLATSGQILASSCGLAAVIGHCYPVWHKFSGGKGAGTLIGVLIALAPAYLLPVLLVWLSILLLSGYVGMATVLAVWVLVPLVFMDAQSSQALQYMLLAAASLILFTHRENLQRLWQGKENRFEKARIAYWLRRQK